MRRRFLWESLLQSIFSSRVMASLFLRLAMVAFLFSIRFASLAFYFSVRFSPVIRNLFAFFVVFICADHLVFSSM